jgi:betaine reductase
MSDFVFAGKRVIALGERDGISGPALAAVIDASGGTVAFSATECFV